MGHYYSEMACSECGDIRCDCWKKNHKLLIKEIEETISKNPIKIKDIKKNSTLLLYNKLSKKSKNEKDKRIGDSLWIINEDYQFLSRLHNIVPLKITKFYLDKENKIIILNNESKFLFNKIHIPIKYFELENNRKND